MSVNFNLITRPSVDVSNEPMGKDGIFSREFSTQNIGFLSYKSRITSLTNIAKRPSEFISYELLTLHALVSKIVDLVKAFFTIQFREMGNCLKGMGKSMLRATLYLPCYVLFKIVQDAAGAIFHPKIAFKKIEFPSVNVNEEIKKFQRKHFGNNEEMKPFLNELNQKNT